MKQQIEYIETGKLIPYARNSRTHSDDQVQQIMGSIKEFGFTNPVLVDGDGVDLFGGSGSTLMAAEKQDKVAFLMELDPKYCDVIIKRWQDFTGQQATLEATGQTYDQLEAERCKAA
jgi:hypothetical protein